MTEPINISQEQIDLLWEKVKHHFLPHYESGSAKIIRDVFGYTISLIEQHKP